MKWKEKGREGKGEREGGEGAGNGKGIWHTQLFLPGRPPAHQTMYDDNRRPVG